MENPLLNKLENQRTEMNFGETQRMNFAFQPNKYILEFLYFS